MERLVRRWWLVATLALGGLGALGGCTAAPEEPAEDVLLRDDLLVPIPRDLDGDAAARRQETVARLGGGDRLRSGPPRTFYFAVRRSALAQRWFWSVYLKELQPWGPSPGTLGTKVIRFREQNGKLYVFDADDRRATSDVFNPDLIIDAFPIVDSHHFHDLPGSGGYILIDPAAGTNRFGALSDMLAIDPCPISVATELSFVEGFRAAPDGGHYEQIITAYADEIFGLPDDVEPNELRIAATLGHSIRRYTETPAYVPVPAPPVPHYFLGEPFNVPGTGEVAQNAVHWGFHPGMQPVAQATAAWQAALAGARAPLDPADLANNPALGPAANALSAAVFGEALVTTRAAIRTPFTRPAVIAAIAADGEAIRQRLDRQAAGPRSIGSRS